MDFLPDFSSGFWIVKRSVFKKRLRFIREEGTDQIREENRWKRDGKEMEKSSSAPDTGAEGAGAEGAKSFREGAAKGE